MEFEEEEEDKYDKDDESLSNEQDNRNEVLPVGSFQYS